MNDDNGRITVSIDLKKNRIRIHKDTLHRLGDPSFIHLLYNPISATMAVQCTEVEDKTTFTIKPSQMASENSIEFYSLSLLNKIRETYKELDGHCTYRLSGSIIPDERLAVFPLNTLQRVVEGEQ